MQHPDKTLATYVWNSWNIWNMHLQHACIANATYATSRKNTYNIRLKQLKHLKHTLKTYVYSHCNICNTRSTFATFRWNTCNIQMKHMKHIHLKHIKHTGCNMCLSTCWLGKWSLIDSELDVGAELIGSTDLGSGLDRWMERGRGGKRESGRETRWRRWIRASGRRGRVGPCGRRTPSTKHYRIISVTSGLCQ